MKRVYINYADANFTIAQACATHSAKRYGAFDEVIELCPGDVDYEFRNRHSALLRQPRGGGYWLWKPHLVQKVFSTLSEGDLLAYIDSGIFLTPGHAKHLSDQLELLKIQSKSIIAFQQCHLERHYTKRDILKLLDCDRPPHLDSGQFWAGAIFLVKTRETQKLVNDWLRWSEFTHGSHYLIDDSPNQLGENHPDFIENRHDQSILSLLLKQHPELLLVRDRDFARNYLHYFHTPNQAVDIFRLNDHKEIEALQNDWWYQFGKLSRWQKIAALANRLASKAKGPRGHP
jgi:hypothetical protein